MLKKWTTFKYRCLWVDPLKINLSRGVSFREVLHTVGRTPRPVLGGVEAIAGRRILIESVDEFLSIVLRRFPVVGVELFSGVYDARRRRYRRRRRAVRFWTVLGRILTTDLLHPWIRVRLALSEVKKLVLINIKKTFFRPFLKKYLAQMGKEWNQKMAYCLPCACGRWIWTLDLRITGRLFYHLNGRHGSQCNNREY